MWYAIVLAGGSGSRMGAGRNKVLLSLNDEPVIVRSVRAFVRHVHGIVLVSRSEDIPAMQAALDNAGLSAKVVPGGDTRQASVWNGLCALPADCTHVMIHDGARCLVDDGTIERCMASVMEHGSGVAAVPVVDTIKRAAADGLVQETPDRSALYAIQTP